MRGVTHAFDSGGQAYTHDGSWELMGKLGLKRNFNREWTDVGTVVLDEEFNWHPYRAQRNALGQFVSRPRVKVEVSAVPAQFYRFTISRSDELTGKPKLFVMRTGSGSFARYWPIAELIAQGMLDVKEVTR